MNVPARTAATLKSILITSRPLFDYRNMFLLADADLVSGPILDCPGGASPFGAQVRARGGTVVSVDPAYGMAPAALAAIVRQHVAQVVDRLASYPELYDGSYVGPRAALHRAFEAAADLFLSDYSPDGQRYVAASLPRLPFPDGHFRLALSGYLLFSYPDHLSLDDHQAYLLELARVAREEVRVYPVVDTVGNRYQRLDELRARLAAHGLETEIRTAACAFHRGCDEMLACWQKPMP